MNPMIFNLIHTLAYFDNFSHPLTAVELWNFLWLAKPIESNYTWADFLHELDEAVRKQTIATSGGFYFLPGRQKLVVARQRARLLVEKKLAIAKRAAVFLDLVPGVEAILVCNTVAAGWPSKQSDIDLLVVVKPGRLWLTRLLFTVATIILTKRRHNHLVADHLCLSFYLTRDHLDLTSVRTHEPDIYLVYWLQQLVLLTGDESTLTQLAKANKWVQSYTPHYNQYDQGCQPVVVTSRLGKTCKRIMENLFFPGLERLAKTIQKKRIDAQSHASAPAVVISDTMLKFHETDRREEYQANWQEQVKQLIAKL